MNPYKPFLTVVAVIVSLTQAFSNQQSNDSIILVQSIREWEEVFPGVKFTRIRFEQKELFSSNQCLHLIEVAPGAVKFALAAEPLLTTTGEMAQKQNAIAAINGSFFKFTNEYNIEDYNSVNYLRINNVCLADNEYSETGLRKMHQEGAVSILDGALFVLKATSEDNWETTIEGQDVISSGPVLAIERCPEPLRDDSFSTTRHPRTAVATKSDGTVMLFIADGRNAYAEGMSLEELQKTLLWLGACDVINFDGGGSSTMYIRGRGEEGVVNYPCDNRQFDHLGSRKVANALYIVIE
ncbi:MAG: phosphodiester glycosidase family protein [Prevotellaceae bacterium]|jgi:exopolysaccharide biosynthesis protein|nr:phosphodiester glycosidase family protein [Prevotellaceae bacterium]